MFISSLSKRMSMFDIYKKVPKDLSYATYSGAIISIIAIVTIVLLTISEIRIYHQVHTQSDMQVQHTNPEAYVKMNFQMIMNHLPCAALSVSGDFVSEHLRYEQLDKNKKVIKEVDNTELLTPDQLLEEYKTGGCKITANFLMSQVKIYSKQFNLRLQDQSKFLRTIVIIWDLQLIYKNKARCNTAYSTVSIIFFSAKKRTIKIFLIWQLEKHEQFLKSQYQDQKRHKSNLILYEQTEYVDTDNKDYQGYEYTFTHSEFFAKTHKINIVYKFSPLKLIQHKVLIFMQYYQDFQIVIVQLCAIIGGILTLAGVLDAFVNKSVVHIMQKYQMGKLN